MIKVKDMWDVIELLGLEAEIFIKNISNRIVKGKVIELKGIINTKVNYIINIKAKIIIIRYYKLEVLFKILYL